MQREPLRYLVWVVVAAALPAIATAQSDMPTVEQVLARHVAASGGREAIEAHRSISRRGTTAVDATGVGGTLEEHRAKPNRYFRRVVMAGLGEITRGFDGATGWLVMAHGATIEQGESLRELQRMASYTFDLHEPTAGAVATFAGSETFDGRRCYVLSVTDGSSVRKDYFDASTGLFAGSMDKLDTPEGKLPRTTVVGEYADFAGIRLPTLVRVTLPGYTITETYSAVRWDEAPDSVFTAPAAALRSKP